MGFCSSSLWTVSGSSDRLRNGLIFIRVSGGVGSGLWLLLEASIKF